MPVKVRCPGCEKVLNAPDAARGKAVRCPECQAKVPVPADGVGAGGVGARKSASAEESAARKKPAKRKASAEDDDFFKQLDLSKAEDHSIRLCHKCGRKLQEEDVQCPGCGLDLITGESAKERALRGPDTSAFYSVAWKDSWKFMVKNKGLVFRTLAYFTIAYTLALGFGALFFWCYNLPPKTFSGAFAIIILLTIPGWIWFLTTQVVAASREKKAKFPRIRFDFFLCTALGLKVLLWQSVFFLPVALLGGVLISILARSGQAIAGLGIAAAFYLLFGIMVPVALVHMSMPVTILAWQFWRMVPITGRVVAPAMYWCFMVFVTTLPALAVAGGVGAMYGEDTAKTLQILTQRSSNQLGRANAAYALENKIKNAPTVESIPEIPLPDLKVLIVPVLSGYLFLWLLAATVVLPMRGLGVFATFFKDRLDLITEVAERKYTYQEKKVDEDGVPIPPPKRVNAGKMMMGGVGGTIVMYVVANAILYFATGGETLLMPRRLAQLLRLAQQEFKAPAEPAPPPAAKKHY